MKVSGAVREDFADMAFQRRATQCHNAAPSLFHCGFLRVECWISQIGVLDLLGKKGLRGFADMTFQRHLGSLP